jgi:hypothetical protein
MLQACMRPRAGCRKDWHTNTTILPDSNRGTRVNYGISDGLLAGIRLGRAIPPGATHCLDRESQIIGNILAALHLGVGTPVPDTRRSRTEEKYPFGELTTSRSRH